MNKIFILTGKKRSGKTTNLMEWCAGKKNIDGILQPVINDKRFIYQIGSRSLRLLEVDNSVPEDEVVAIGNYRFSLSTFEWCRKIISSAAARGAEWLLIDEVGPLELKGKGLEPAVGEILEGIEKIKSKVVLVVREDLLDKIIEHYNLKDRFRFFNFE